MSPLKYRAKKRTLDNTARLNSGRPRIGVQQQIQSRLQPRPFYITNLLTSDDHITSYLRCWLYVQLLQR
jgi:hypothetical protein